MNEIHPCDRTPQTCRPHTPDLSADDPALVADRHAFRRPRSPDSSPARSGPVRRHLRTWRPHDPDRAPGRSTFHPRLISIPLPRTPVSSRPISALVARRIETCRPWDPVLSRTANGFLSAQNRSHARQTFPMRRNVLPCATNLFPSARDQVRPLGRYDRPPPRPKSPRRARQLPIISRQNRSPGPTRPPSPGPKSPFSTHEVLILRGTDRPDPRPRSSLSTAQMRSDRAPRLVSPRTGTVSRAWEHFLSHGRRFRRTGEHFAARERSPARHSPPGCEPRPHHPRLPPPLEAPQQPHGLRLSTPRCCRAAITAVISRS